MPAALERKLKRQVGKKDWSEERKDAYVYGTLRKTGWKPSHQKKKEKQMDDPSKLVRLSAISKGLDSIIEFQDPDDDDYNRRRGYGLGGTAVGVGIGAGGVLGHQAIQRAGGYRAVGSNLATTFKGAAEESGRAAGSTARNIWAGTKAVGAQAGRAAGSAWTNILKKLGIAGAKALSSKERVIEFAGPTEDPTATILAPFQGPTGHTSKIDQLEFPAGLSPLAAMRLSLPQLARFLQQRNHLQQVFSRKEKLIELSEKLDAALRL